MPNINALIARGGGYQPPSFDYATSQQNKLNQETRGLQNQYLQQQIAAQPEQQKIEAQRMQLEKELLRVQKEAFNLAQKGGGEAMTTYVTVGDQQYKVTGPAKNVGIVTSKAIESMDQLDQNFAPWAASEYQVGIEPVDPKAPVMGTPEHLKAFEEQERIRSKYKDPTAKDSQTYLLPNKTTALSFDGGRTYIGEDGKSRKMPSGAVKITTTFTGPEMSMLRTQRQVEQDMSPQAGQRQPEAMGEVAISGTGPYSMLEAAVDKILGGFGVDLVIGKEGFFPDTQENRQVLRAIKQTGKNALMNSARGAIWEQKRIDELFPDPDKFFTNPRTEAQKFKVLRDTLMAERTHNNEAIVAATDPKVVSDLARSNVEIDRLFSLIGREKTDVPAITNNEEFRQLPSGTKFRDPQGNIRMKP